MAGDSCVSASPGVSDENSGSVYRRLLTLGVVLSIAPGGALAFDAPAGVVGDELLAEMRAHRDELSALVRAVPVVVHLRMDAFDMRIDRQTKWGNPFIMRSERDRAIVIAKYRDWILTKPDLLAALPELVGKRLGCHCAPLPCHGDVLAELVRDRVVSVPVAQSFIEPIPGVICPWCRRGDRLVASDAGLDCYRCGRLAFRFQDDGSIERADYVEMVAVDVPIPAPSSGVVASGRKGVRVANTARPLFPTECVDAAINLG